MTGVRSEVVERVLHIELSRPEKRNAIGYDMLAELQRLWPRFEQRDFVGVVLSGSGEHFSAGADLKALTGTVDDKAFDDEMERVIEGISAAPVPVVAAVSGSCVGAAVDLVMACDIRVADYSASFRVPAVHLGLLYNPAAIARMHRSISPDVLHRLLVLAERLDAADAQATGLVSILTDDIPRVRAHQLILDGADSDPQAVAETRRLLIALTAGKPLDDQHWAETRLRLLESPSRNERVARAQRKERTDDNSR